MPKQLMLYLPVIHAGYERLLTRHAEGAEVLLLGTTFGDDYPVIRKEIRALEPERAAAYVRASVRARSVRVIERDDLPDAVTGPLLVVPDDQIMRSLVRRYSLSRRVRRVEYVKTFLRWDRKWSRAERPPSFRGRVALDDMAVGFARMAHDLGSRSSDWWRQVGAVAVRDGEVIGQTYNAHVPSEYSPYLNGDPRNDYRRGLRPDLTTALHAEAALVAIAARDGVSLLDADLYVSTFPCPSCARLVAAVGFRRCFFAGGYSMLDGDEILRQAGVDTYFVQMDVDAAEQLTFADLEGEDLMLTLGHRPVVENSA